MSSSTIEERIQGDRFVHAALFYAGTADFVDRTGAFIRESVAAEEPILVVVNAEKIELLRHDLGGDPAGVRFADMALVGQNPARIIPAWREFVAEQTSLGGRFRGIGEPIWADRNPNELDECERHEALLNLAFEGTPPWSLACPYDTESLAPAVLEEAMRNHPFVVDGGEHTESDDYRGLADVAEPFDRPLPEPAIAPDELSFGLDAGGLSAVRRRVGEAASAFDLGAEQTDNLVVAVNEVITNSLRHGGGNGVLRIWRDGPALICEIRDGGRIEDPLAGRTLPSTGNASGFGLWLANHLCDLVQIRTFPTGSVVRLHIRR